MLRDEQYREVSAAAGRLLVLATGELWWKVYPGADSAAAARALNTADAELVRNTIDAFRPATELATG